MLIKTQQNKLKNKAQYICKKNKAEIIVTEIRKTIEKSYQTKSCFFEETDKINKLLGILTKYKREKNSVNNIRNKQEVIPWILKG